MNVWLDTADPDVIRDSDAEGFTTNPVLLRGLLAATPDGRTWGTTSYWAQTILFHANGRPVSFEVHSSTLAEMEREAHTILGWGPNVFVKIPIQTPQGLPTAGLIRNLERVNATCCFTESHVEQAVVASAAICSVFAGRIADTGRDPSPLFNLSASERKVTRMLWASTRQVYSIIEAEKAGADIITLPPDLYAKRALLGRSLQEYALTTVKEFCQ